MGKLSDMVRGYESTEEKKMKLSEKVRANALSTSVTPVKLSEKVRAGNMESTPAAEDDAAKFGIIEDEEDTLAEKLSHKYTTEGKLEEIADLQSKDRFNKTYKDTFMGQAKANNAAAALAEKESLAWSRYLDTGSDADYLYATEVGRLREEFEQENETALDNENVKAGWISKTMASYLPQLANQAKYAAVGVLPGIAAGNPMLARAGYGASQGLYAYQTMRGAAYKTLVDAGVDPETARKAAQDEAVVNGMIEAAEALFTLGSKGGKLLDKAAGKDIAADTLKTALKKYGINIGTEALQEGTQEAVSYANQNREDKDAGMLNLAGEALKTGGQVLTGKNKEAAQQIGAAAGEGAKIAAMLGAVSSAGSYLGQQRFDANAKAEDAAKMQPETTPGEIDIEELVADLDTETADVIRRVYAKRKNGTPTYDAETIMQGAKVAPTDKTAPSQYATNTMKQQADLGLFDEDVANSFANASHRVVSQADTTAAAKQLIADNGFDDVRRYLQDKMEAKQALNSVEIDAAMQIAQELSYKAKDPASRDVAFKFIESLANKGTSEAGRALAQIGASVRNMEKGLLYYVARRMKENGGATKLTASEQQTILTLDKLLKEAETLDAMSEAERLAVLAEYTSDMDAEYAALINEAFKKSSENDSSAAWIMRLAEKMVASKVGSNYVDKYAALQRINLLGNLKTQMRGVAGNLLSFTAENASDITASIVDNWLASKTGKRTVGKGNFAAALQGGKEAVADVNKARKLGVLNLMDDRYKEGNRPRALNVWSNNKKAGKVLNTLNEWTSYLLTLGDAMYSGARKAQVDAQLRDLNEGTDAAWVGKVAEQAGKETTFQNDSNLAKFALFLRNAGKNFDDKNLQLAYEFTTRVLMPFVKTPANILSRTFSYSPAGLVEGIVRAYSVINDATGADPVKQRKAAVAIGRGLTGTLISAAGAGLAAAGKASGKADEDKDKAAFMKEVGGVLPNSIKIGDMWVDLSNLGPGMVALNAGATVYNDLVDEGFDATTAWRAVQALLDSAVSDVTGDSLWQGVLDTVGYIEDEDYKGLAVEFAGDVLSQLIPAQSFMRAIAGSVDKYKRETSAEGNLGWSLNYIFSNIPGVSSKMPVKYDVTGNPVERYEGGKASDIFNAWLNPAAGMSKDKTDSELYQQIMDVYEETGDKSVFPTVAPYSVTYKGEKYALRGKERSEYQQASGKEITQQLDELFASKAYKQATSEQQVDMIANLISYATAEAKTGFLEGKEVKYEKSGISATIDKLAAYDVPASAVVMLAATDRDNAKDANGDTIENSGAIKAAKAINKLGLSSKAEKAMLEQYANKTVAAAYEAAKANKVDVETYLDTYQTLYAADAPADVIKAVRNSKVKGDALLSMLTDTAETRYGRFDSRWTVSGRSYKKLSAETYTALVLCIDGSKTKAENVKRLMAVGLSQKQAADFYTVYNSDSNKYD